MNRIDLILENLSAQRNMALDQLAIAKADLAIALERIKELEKEGDGTSPSS